MYSEEWGSEVARRIETTLDELAEFAFNQENASDELEPGELAEPETPSGYSFCGCHDCYERERTYLAMQLALEGHAQGLIELIDPELRSA